MLVLDENEDRSLRTESVTADLVIVGGGMAGSCAAITAARQGLRVALVQDRPVLGGNASSEVRLWMVGATSHMGNNNRWAREGGVLNEILLENTHRNPEGNPVLFDTVLLEKVAAEPTLTLLLNTAVFEVGKDDQGAIRSVTAFCSQNSTRYVLQAPLFCDASGDGIVGFLAGAAFRIGVESQAEFGELLAPAASSRQLLGHSIYFYTRDTGRPTKYVAPSYALDDIRKIPRYRRFSTKTQGTDLWWIEYGGSTDTVHEAESIKWELWKIIYGVWHHIKNSGEFPDAETLTLDWVGLIPGKRESRRFEGDYILVQQDIVGQRVHEDAVSFGGWAIDHHPVDNVYSEEAPCAQWHSKGVYQIPYRTMYSRNVPNLFLAGRILSASHVAFGSSRVMATCGHNGQAVGMAAALCRERDVQPRQLTQPHHLRDLQLRLLRSGQWIPHVRREDPVDLAQRAEVTATSHLERLDLKPVQPRRLSDSRALLVPAASGKAPVVTLYARPCEPTSLIAELRCSSRDACYTPDVILDQLEVALNPDDETDECVGRRVGANGLTPARQAETAREEPRRGAAAAHADAEVSPSAVCGAAAKKIRLEFEAELPRSGYAFVCLRANDSVEVYESEQLVTGIVTVRHAKNAKVANSNEQAPPIGSGVDRLEFWLAERRPRGRNLAADARIGSSTFAPQNVVNGFQRPTSTPNAWVASPDDSRPTLTLTWPEPQSIRTVELVFDPDWDHPMENVVMQHPERVMPFVVRDFRVLGDDGDVLIDRRDNHQAVARCELNSARPVSQLKIELEHPSATTPASLFEVRCYQ